MRKRKRRIVVFVLASCCFLFLLSVYLLSSCTEVSYMVQFTSVSKDRESEVKGRLWGALPYPPDLRRPCLTRSNPPAESRTTHECNCNPEFHVPKCQVVHVAVVCAGYESSRRLVTLVKSLLFHRRNPIHLHVIVDDVISRPILTTLFSTWSVPALEYSFYSAAPAESDVSWIPNKHYSGIYGLLKLTLPKLLPNDLKKVLVLDTDILFVADPAELWSYWSKFSGAQLMALVENQSEWYLGKLWKGQTPWPALGRGLNSGVMLMDLERMRDANWMQEWRRVAERHLQRLQSTALADQDIINAILLERPDWLLKLPCEWNLQLGDRAMQDICLSSTDLLKIIHWNSPQKMNIRSRYAEFFRRHYQTFLEMDGNLLRRELMHCSANITNNGIGDEQHDSSEYGEDYDDSGCYEFRRAHKFVYRTHIYFSEYQYTPKEMDVSLVAQLSMDRLQMLVGLLEHWEGPASIALYLSDAEAKQFSVFLSESPILSRRRDIGFHIVFKQGGFFPVNSLRNVALRHVQTDYVYLCDIDFLPMFGLYDTLRQAIAAQGDMDRKALIIPAFETQKYRFAYPRSKAELINMWDTGQLFMFRQDVWTKGHTATDYEKWRTAAAPYPISWRTDFEPYIVVSRDVPPYDTRFVGFGWNKVSHIMELDALGFDFVVLPNAFMIHLPHAPSFEITKYRSSPQYRKCLKILKGEFLRDLSRKYTSRVKVKLLDTRVLLNNATDITKAGA